MCISMCVLEACSRRTAPNPLASQPVTHLTSHFCSLTHSLALSLSLNLTQRAQCYVFATGPGRAIIGFSENNASATVCLERCGATVTATAAAMVARVYALVRTHSNPPVLYTIKTCDAAAAAAHLQSVRNVMQTEFADNAARRMKTLMVMATATAHFGIPWGKYPLTRHRLHTNVETCRWRISVAYSDVRPVGS